jgi:16S rRNA (cytosine1402-N4)-methyltransferase
MIEHGGYHEPVLKKEVCDLLITDMAGVYLDCTLGGGGHFMALAGKLSTGATMIGIDRDPDAINWNRNNQVSSNVHLIIEQCRFSQFDSVLQTLGIDTVNGIFLDLGVSSFQIDSAERGFSYMRESDLDMRMNSSEGISARELIQRSSIEELSEILKSFGEVQNPQRMAETIKNCKFPVKTSVDLRNCLVGDYGPNLQIKVFAKVFQALRIAVNDEMGELRIFLSKAIEHLVPGGRLAVISYHSLEDRMVKEFIREQESGCICPPEIPYCICEKQSLLKRVTKKAVKAADSEINQNPRSRSARLRVAERVGVACDEKK